MQTATTNATAFLLEILTQELPAKPFLKELPQILTKWQNALQNANITTSHTQLFYTPRRIVLYCEDFALFSNEQIIESFGAPLNIAYDNDGNLSKAGLSFFAKNNLDPIRDKDKVSKALKDGKEVLYFKETLQGRATKELMQDVVDNFLQSLHFGKSMRWGDLASKIPNFDGFIRPIVSVCAFLGEAPLPLCVFGLESSAQTYPHRDFGYNAIEVKNIGHYFEILQKNCVILDQNERKAKILSQIEAIKSAHHIDIELDSELLEEIVAITEYPQSLLGYFEKEFLCLPKEVIITSMKENQRYFALYKEDSLFNGFIVVSNSTSKDTSLIVKGNEKVLRARLSDAMFFYENDLKRGLNAQGLESVLFVEGLGTLAQKSLREGKIAQVLVQKFSAQLIESVTQNANYTNERLFTLLQESITLAKADLLSEMVGEFPELQGIMGSYYAQSEGKDALLVKALREQYLPNSEHSALPSSLFSAIVALSYKLDNILSLFSINKIPSGSKDPYALRRAALGVIKIILLYKLPFNLSSDLRDISYALGFEKLNVEQIADFFLDRLESHLELNPSIFRASVNAQSESGAFERDILNLTTNANALNSVFEESTDKPALLSTFKRVANICKESSAQDFSTSQKELFSLPQEQALFNALTQIQNTQFESTKARMSALFGLKDILESFFDKVLINDKNPQIATNRKALVFSVYREFLRVGDIAQIAI
ncbi:glycine--tRNA ligase subunit beta [Helicobacter himalayensis]|uniref:glycine--tRNA ligase subunit beta n=1 Tax=Helicobacter himalayensis TaxID=1591088 RepID=UPI003D6DDA0B